tara:strand:+ start:867 stop:1547 length:681 start_codon:yes stop_codon:yes gene_type:complete
MRFLIKIKFIIIILVANFAFAENIIEKEEDLYQIKIILISHNKDNYIEYDKKFFNDKYTENETTKIVKNNCVIKEVNFCTKYDLDYKLDNFNDYKKSLDLDKDINVITHMEWVQKIDRDNYVKIKGGHDYSNEIFEDNLSITDIDILSTGKILKYEGSFLITKKKFFLVDINLFEKMIMKTPGFFSTDVLTSRKYIINQNIMLNRITYIDRDNFGIIIKISKIKGL